MKNVYVLLQLLGLISLIFFPIGTILGVILIIYGGIKYREINNLAKCPGCAESVNKEAKICKHCGMEFE